VTSDVFKFDFDGNLIGTIESVGRIRKYGLEYWPLDPDGYNLYILNRIAEPLGDTKSVITKLDTNNEDTLTVYEFPDHDGSSGWQGLSITSGFDIYSWVMMSVDNLPDGDVLSIIQLVGRKEWMSIEPTSGELPASSEQTAELILDSRTLPIEIYRGELVLTHNAAGSVLTCQIEMWVGISDVGEDQATVPGTLELMSSYPNPFNNSTQLAFVVPTDGRGSLTIYDIQGRIVEKVVDFTALKAGSHTFNWSTAVAGVYFARLEFESPGNSTEIRTQKLICLP
jgi:hypothetical protein